MDVSMLFKQVTKKQFKRFLITPLLGLLVACGSGCSESEVPVNQLPFAMFIDLDSSVGKIGGPVVINLTYAVKDHAVKDQSKVKSVWIYWSDDQKKKVAEAWFKSDPDNIYQIDIPLATVIPNNVSGLILVEINAAGESEQTSHIRFHDFIGNASLSGPGGDYDKSWHYGEDRPHISIQRVNGLCTFDNGFVSVIDMANEKDAAWLANSGSGLSNQTDDVTFSPYAFQCDPAPYNDHRLVEDEVGVWTYSTINDSMYYGTLAYMAFVKSLGEPPLREKIRLRVHYGGMSDQSAYWDGAYANFGDAHPFYFSMVTFDAIAHEVAHGVLNRISNLNLFEQDLSTDARTLHEAFADISGVMAKSEYTGYGEIWIHGEEFYGFARHLDQIETEYGAITSLLDYDDAGKNFYQRIGMITYPFYLLANEWGIERAYQVYLAAAKNCWTATTTLTEAAVCIKQQAGQLGLSQQAVIDAFKTVKIKLFEEGVLSHFKAAEAGLTVNFIDGSESTSQLTSWLWDFADGQSSTQQSPSHSYTLTGEYKVRLTVTDQSGDQDYFERTLSVTNE
jgi:vibriolysin